MKNELLLKKILASIVFLIIIIFLISNEWYWTSLILLFFLASFLFTSKEEYEKIEKKKKLKKIEKIKNIGMYNMEKSETYQKKSKLLENIHFFLGVVFQGRMDEFENTMWEIINEKTIYGEPINNNIQKIFIDNENKLKTACKIAKKYDDMDGYDMKMNESFGEYFDRKIAKNKKFMDIFIEINKIDFENEIHKEIEIEPYNKQKIKKKTYNPLEIRNRGIQLLESFNIMSTTKNIDTLKGRFEFISKFYNDFIQYSKNKRYITDIQKAIDEYKLRYYDKILNDFELKLLVNPNSEHLKEFYLDCLNEAFKEYVLKQEGEINKLKMEKAKNRRKENIINIANETITEIKSIKPGTDKAKEYIKEINKIINKYKIN